jgi:hypothetical protein
VPDSDMGYAIGVDSSRGTGATPSCMSIGNVATGEKVAEYVTAHEEGRPDRFAARAVALAKWFKSRTGVGAHIAWERTGPGEVFGKTVLELGWENVYYPDRSGKKKSSKKFLGDDSLRTPGWVPNRASKYDLLDEYQTALAQRRFINRSTNAVRECEHYKMTPLGVRHVKHGTSTKQRITIRDDESGATENHGDRVIADALCNRGMRSMGGGGLRDIAKRAAEESPASLVGTMAGRMQLAAENSWEQELWGV